MVGLKNVVLVKKGDKWFIESLISEYIAQINDYTVNQILSAKNKKWENLDPVQKYIFENLIPDVYIDKDGSDIIVKTEGLHSLSIEITSNCNLSCKHCAIRCGPRTTNPLTLPKKKFTEVLIDAYDLGAYSISITGGEPFMDDELIEKIKFCRDLGFKVEINTNGTLINDDLAKNLHKLEVAHVAVSIDGFKESHEFLRGKGTFEKAINGLKKLLEYGIEASVITCVYEKNKDHIDEFYLKMKELGVRGVNITPIYPLGRAKNNKELMLPFDELGKIFKKYRNISNDIEKSKEFRELFAIPCGLFRRTIHIGSNGDVHPCPLFIDFVIDNVYKRRLKEIYEDPPKKVYELLNLDPRKVKGPIGCRARAYMYTNDLYGEDIFLKFFS